MSLAEMMFRMHDEGEISDETLLLYGMSGALPDPEWLGSLPEDKREEYWDKKFSENLGEDWRERFRSLPAFLRRVVVSSRLIPRWARDGF